MRSNGFSMKVNGVSVDIKEGIQMEVDAGYENKDSILLIEAKSSSNNDEIIRQIYFPFRDISQRITNDSGILKKVRNIFISLDKKNSCLNFYEYIFEDKDVYDSIKLIKSARYAYKI